VAAIAIEDGRTVWQNALASPAVKNGLAIDGSGRIYVSLRDGTIVCLSGGR
jgi:outer membrane protein assembly factor BamB